MAQKSAKIDDVKTSDKVTPAATSRPIVVANRPMLASDPMLANGEPKDDKVAAAADPVTRTTKTIKPLDADAQAPAEAAGVPEAEAVDNPEKAAEEPAAAAEPVPEAKKEAADSEPAPTEDEAAKDTEDAKGPAADEAAMAEAEAKKAAREAELEQLVTSGKYAVPINAVGRKRSRMYVMLLCLFALVLAAVLFDIVLDAGVVKVGGIKPLTHFFNN